jgi:hypothetical protein
MTLFGCARARDVQQAGASGRWTAELDAHVRACSSCADVRLVTEAFFAGAASDVRHERVDPALLFSRAREERRLHAEVRMSRVTMLTQIVIAFGMLGVLMLFVQAPAWPDASVWNIVAAGIPADPRIWVYGGCALVLSTLFVLSRIAAQDA